MRWSRVVLCAAAWLLVVPAASVAASPKPPGPVFEAGEAQPIFDKAQVVRESLYVTAPVDSDRDGHADLVHVVVVRPKATEQGLRVPVVYQASPYFSGVNHVANHDVETELHASGRIAARTRTSRAGAGRMRPTNFGSAYEEYLLARGYAVVYAESLGAGMSTGCPTTGGDNETIGARSVIDWLNSRAPGQDAQGAPVSASWSTGKVAMMGASYDGTLANAVASTGVEGLQAIVPIEAISDWYEYYRADGAVVAPAGYQGEDADVLAKSVYTRQDRVSCQPVIDRLAAGEDRVTGDYNGFWDARNYLNHADKVHAAVLAVQGLNDWNVKTKQTAQWYAALRRQGVPHKIWWHRSGHIDPLTSRKDEWLRTLNRWFTRYLYGISNGVEGEPRSTVEREDATWVQEPEWPAPQARNVLFRPTPGGRGQGGLEGLHVDDRAVEELSDDAGQRAEDLAGAANSPNRLAYFTEPVGHPVRVSGTPHAELPLAFDRSAANVTALLVDQAPDGSTSVLTRGWADPQNRRSAQWSSPVHPGEHYSIDVAMQPTDYILPAGHKWGLVVLSSDHDFTLRPKPGTQLRLELTSSQLRLPLVRTTGL
jgi:X-Pro dipeptidyl-peptidase